MSKRPTLYLIKGDLADAQQSLYSLRKRTHAPAVENWPKDGEWRSLIQRLTRNPTKAK